MDTDTKKLIAKVDARGTVWTSYFIAYGTYAYKMEAFGSGKYHYETIDEIIVRPKDGKKGKGWEIVLFGEPMPDKYKYKNEAQREAEKLLDNERDKHGWLMQNTGRIY